MASSRVFVLSPARCDGVRAKLLLAPRAEFPLAVRLREREGVELGEVFSFLSGLYFRGKLTYARTFAVAPRRVSPILIITADRGLVPPETRVRRDDLERFSGIDISAGDARYHGPFERDIAALASGLPRRTQVILLGSIATGKYVDSLVAAFDERLLCPVDFVGRGDMSRGGLLLRSAREGRELGTPPSSAPNAGANDRRGSSEPPRRTHHECGTGRYSINKYRIGT
jgi:hypothetical protein